jgi:hypothetical protein
MTLVFKSTTAEVFQIVGRDSDGSKRVATGINTGFNRWDVQLEHPSGRAWKRTYSGTHILDALGKLVNDHDGEFKQEKARGHKPAPAMLHDRNHSLPDGAPDTAIYMDPHRDYRPRRI